MGDRLPASLRGAGREAIVVVALHETGCAACEAYAARLASLGDEIAEWDGRVTYVRDVVNGLPSVTIADQWGEIAVTETARDAHELMPPAEVVTWLRYLAMKCPECEGEAL